MVNKHSFLVIIPARAGSQRLPGKNMKVLGDKPLIGHSIAYAKAQGFTSIVVTTNDPEISHYARQEQVAVIKRPDEFSLNESLVITALQHALSVQKQKFDYVILLQPTNPLRPNNLLKTAINRLKSADFDSLMTVSELPRKIGKIGDQGYIPFNYTMGQRSQDLEPLYAENGLLYIIRTNLIKEGKLIGEKNYPLVVDHPFAAIDIDTLEDFKKAALYLENFKP